MIVKKYCPKCKQRITVSAETRFANIAMQTFTCGHSEAIKTVSAKSFEDFISTDGNRPFKFQIEGALFGIQSNARCLIGDEMGLGKTVQAEMIIWSDELELTPFLVLCKSRLKIQWARENLRWTNKWISQVIESENDFIMPGCKAYILSYDMLWRFKDIETFMKRIKIKCVVIDEVQHIKNTNSKRTNGVRKVCAGIEHIIALSGTPVKNNGLEYFPVLNLLYPNRFPTVENYQVRFLQTYNTGYSIKTGGFREPEKFRDYTKDFIIRRTREEVLPDLPVITRNFMFSELGDAVEEAYKAELKKFQEYYNESGDDSALMRASNILAYMSRMRHLTGLAKIDPTVSYVEDFINDTDRKITIFLHHKDVADALYARLEELQRADPNKWGSGILQLKSGADTTEILDAFKLPQFRILIASTLSSGEGLNMQFCSDCIMMERQWNPANEEQAEARFIRIGQLADRVSGTYMVAVGTIDEFFSTLVEKKRSVCKNVVDFKETDWNESSLMQELAEVLALSGGKKWSF